ncbi:Orf108 [Heliothis zea nudivirus]|uniref:Orf108 n=1 Tax=Heliothis zea nudivirus 1 TaxID=3116536 RepID=Q8JKK5_9VIRU|nr:Orf108 [Heliothis zea nudivirus]AAN04402.1 Orf108 [Heliothis zea nudivirus]
MYSYYIFISYSNKCCFLVKQSLYFFHHLYPSSCTLPNLPTLNNIGPTTKPTYLH